MSNEPGDGMEDRASSPARPPLRLSVVIPCFNAEATLGEQLAAVAGQE